MCLHWVVLLLKLLCVFLFFWHYTCSVEILSIVRVLPDWSLVHPLKIASLFKWNLSCTFLILNFIRFLKVLTLISSLLGMSSSWFNQYRFSLFIRGPDCAVWGKNSVTREFSWIRCNLVLFMQFNEFLMANSIRLRLELVWYLLWRIVLLHWNVSFRLHSLQYLNVIWDIFLWGHLWSL